MQFQKYLVFKFDFVKFEDVVTILEDEFEAELSLGCCCMPEDYRRSDHFIIETTDVNNLVNKLNQKFGFHQENLEIDDISKLDIGFYHMFITGDIIFSELTEFENKMYEDLNSKQNPVCIYAGDWIYFKSGNYILLKNDPRFWKYL